MAFDMGCFPSKLVPNHPLQSQLISELDPEDVTWNTGVGCHNDNTSVFAT